MSSCWRQVAGGVELSLRLTPRSSRDKILGLSPDGRILRVAVTAAPVDGQANVALLKFLSKTLDVPASRLSILRGESARQKTVFVAGDDLTPSGWFIQPG